MKDDSHINKKNADLLKLNIKELNNLIEIDSTIKESNNVDNLILLEKIKKIAKEKDIILLKFNIARDKYKSNQKAHIELISDFSKIKKLYDDNLKLSKIQKNMILEKENNIIEFQKKIQDINENNKELKLKNQHQDLQNIKQTNIINKQSSEYKNVLKDKEKLLNTLKGLRNIYSKLEIEKTSLTKKIGQLNKDLNTEKIEKSLEIKQLKLDCSNEILKMKQLLIKTNDNISLEKLKFKKQQDELKKILKF